MEVPMEAAELAQSERVPGDMLTDFGDVPAAESATSRIPPEQEVQDTLRLKQAELQALGIQLQLEGNSKTRQDIQTQVKQVNQQLQRDAIRQAEAGFPETTPATFNPLPTYKRTEENQKIQKSLEEKLFGNVIERRGVRPIVNRPGWNYTRVNMGLGM